MVVRGGGERAGGGGMEFCFGVQLGMRSAYGGHYYF